MIFMSKYPDEETKKKIENYADSEAKYYRREYIRRHGDDPFGKAEAVARPPGFEEYRPPFKLYWNEELGVGVMEHQTGYIGVACLVAKEITEPENYVKKFGLSFKGDIHWKAAPVLLDHLSRSPVFKGVLVTIRKLPFETAPDVPEDLKGRIDWAKRNYGMHHDTAETLKRHLEDQKYAWGGPYPRYLPKQIKEEETHARAFLDSVKMLETQAQQHLKNYFQIKETLFGAALFFYLYTSPQDTFELAAQEITNRRKAAKIEMRETYFVACDEVHDPLVVFNPEVFPLWDRVRRYYGVALAADVAGFTADQAVAGVLRKMFTMTLDVPAEEMIDEQIHIPSEEVSAPGPRRAFLGHVVESVIKRKVSNKRVYFPIDSLTSHGLILGKTRSGKSFLALNVIAEALKIGIKVKVFDPHGTLVSRLANHPLLEKTFTRGAADITERLRRIYDEASGWTETNTLRLLVVLDETQLLKGKNLVACLNELGKRGVGFILITQYATTIPPIARNLGTVFIMAAMSETEMERFRDVTLHPSAKLIPRLPKGMSFVFSPAWYPEPFFVKHRNVQAEDPTSG
jgi:hypothetical protein